MLVDPHYRALLVEVRNPDNGELTWMTVGGGIEDGENPADAAAREVLEETGHDGLRLDRVVREHWVDYNWHGIAYRQHEQWFIATVEAFEATGRFRDEDERSEIRQARWWTVDELCASTALFSPADLPQFLIETLTNRAD
ncbi:NUDIX domain-containing protein [Mycobacterium sp.]|uniref:NUDIX domain-containing protein n=1 Tax=Mycobacterium sp. TaxID=1785 RepID=UPI003F9B35A8